MGGYAHTWTDLKPGGADVNTGWGGLYAGYFNRGLYLLGSIFGGGNSISTSRATAVGDRADSSTDSEEFSTFLSAGYDFHFGHLTIGPTAALQYSGHAVPTSIIGRTQPYGWKSGTASRPSFLFHPSTGETPLPLSRPRARVS